MCIRDSPYAVKVAALDPDVVAVAHVDVVAISLKPAICQPNILAAQYLQMGTGGVPVGHAG